VKNLQPKLSKSILVIGSLFSLSFTSFEHSVLADTLPSPSFCSRSECRFNQSSGTSTTVGVGVNSSFGVSSSAQGSSNYNSSSSASLILNAFDAKSPDSSYNSSTQSIGSNSSDAPIKVLIGTDTIQSKNKDGVTTQIFSDSEQSTSSNNFVEGTTSSSTADFSAEGFVATQDLRFKGSPDSNDGSEFKSEVAPVVVLGTDGNQAINSGYGTGNSSATAQTSTRLQADITTSNFVNAFMSSY